MTYAAIKEQIQSIPEEYLVEISEFIKYIQFKAEKNNKVNLSDNTTKLFGSIEYPIDGMIIQREARNEWN